MALAFVFPGQGSQVTGMGRDLAAAFPAAREIFQEVDEALKQNLSRLMFEGPAEELTLTANAQPALMAHSLAVLRVLEREGGFDLAARVALVAGHSLGEYSALTAARAFALPTAARLLRLRGEAMQRATPPGTGAMAALLGAEAEQAQSHLRRSRRRPRDRRARGGRGRQRQWRRPGGRLRRQGRGGARGRGGQGGRREARHAAARLRPLPLRPDGARRRRDGRGAGERRDRAARRARGGQCQRRQGDRPGRDPRPPGASR